MSRRSSRLSAIGYYNTEGEPIISYKETTHSTFRRRRRSRSPSQMTSSQRSSPQMTSSHMTSSIRVRDRNNHINSNSNININRNRNSNSNMIRNRSSRPSTMLKVFGVLFITLIIGFGFAYLVPTLNSNVLDSRPSESPVSPTNMNTDPACETMAEKLRDLEDELLSLKNKIKHLLPAAHTLPNYALESLGACVRSSLSSRTYHPETDIISLWKRFWQRRQYERTVIQGITSLLPGKCWPFEGARGHLVITLSHPITISHVTLSHISKNVSPTGSISSAPKEFSVHVMKTLDDEGTQLGTFLYDQDGDSVQTFKLPEHKKGVFSHVKLQVKSNWGNPDYTCVYSFRVHGELTEDEH